MTRFFLICLGGAAGTGARYLLSGWLQGPAVAGFPYGTLAVNVLGSFLIAVVARSGAIGSWIPADLKSVLVTGVLGGFTTYSAFNHEALSYIQDGEPLRGIAYIAVMTVACLASGALGLLL